MYKRVLIYCNELDLPFQNKPLQYSLSELWETSWSSETCDLNKIIWQISHNEYIYLTISLNAQQISELLMVIGKHNKLNKLKSLK